MLKTDRHPLSTLFEEGPWLPDSQALIDLRNADLVPFDFCPFIQAFYRDCRKSKGTLPDQYRAFNGVFLEVTKDPEPVLLIHHWKRPRNRYTAVDQVLEMDLKPHMKQLLLTSLVPTKPDPELEAYLSAAGIRWSD